MEAITGTAAGVPFTALPPADTIDGPAPLVVTWHMMDSPRTDAAFAAALPMNAVPAWRVHLGMPMCGVRMRGTTLEALLERAQADPMQAYVAPFVRQAVEEFPAALAAIREQLPVDDGPIGVVGGSLGGAVALRVLAGDLVPVVAAAVVNPAVRARSVVELFEQGSGQPYAWTDEARQNAAELDFVARSGDFTGRTPLLLVSGEQDFPGFRADATELVDALRLRYRDPEQVQLQSIPGLAHPLAEEPGLEPAPQLPVAAAVDEAMTEWFRRYLK